jgi:hypothetical protein
MTKTYSIEIGHIYQDMELNNEYLNLLKKSIKKSEEFSFGKVNYKILIDDLNIKEVKWKIKDLLEFLNKNNIKIDTIAYESMFSEIGQEIEKKLNVDKLIWEEKINKNIMYIKKGRNKIKIKTIENGKTHYSCSFLSACWQLCRLGLFEYPKEAIIIINNKNIKTNNVLNIIEKKYEKVENNVQVILEEYNLEQNIKNIFI